MTELAWMARIAITMAFLDDVCATREELCELISTEVSWTE